MLSVNYSKRNAKNKTEMSMYNFGRGAASCASKLFKKKSIDVSKYKELSMELYEVLPDKLEVLNVITNNAGHVTSDLVMFNEDALVGLCYNAMPVRVSYQALLWYFAKIIEIYNKDNIAISSIKIQYLPGSDKVIITTNYK